jgi:hypothetical protein
MNTVKAYRGSRGIALLILDLVTNWGEESTSSLSHLTLGEITPIMH